MRLSFIHVTTWNQAEILREVRNSCRDGMTHDVHEITVEEQRKFWADELLEGKTFECYLLLDDHAPVGYGLLKWEEARARYWMTAGVTPQYRGKSLSRLLINFITEMGHREGRPVWIDVYDDNLALIGDIKNGFEFVESNIQPDGKILHLMRHNRERVLHPREAFKLVEKTGKRAFTTADIEDVAAEMVEVDQISREYQHVTAQDHVRAGD